MGFIFRPNKSNPAMRAMVFQPIRRLTFLLGKDRSEELHRRSIQQKLGKAEFFGESLLKAMNLAVERGARSDLIYAAVSYAADKVAPIGKAFLRTNYENSGVGKKTDPLKYRKEGLLARGMMGIQCKFTLRGRAGPRLYFTMPPNMPNYRDGTPFYTVAGSLQYGAVRQGRKSPVYIDLPTGEQRIAGSMRKRMGQKMARTLKRAVLGGKGISSREEAAMERSNNRPVAFTRGEKSSKVLTGRGHTFTVIHPFNFFALNESQRRNILDRFAKAFSEKLTEKMGAAESVA